MTLVKNKIVVPSQKLANLLSDGSWTNGCVFSETEMRNLLTETGFKNPRLLRVENHDTQVMVAQK